jgi:hypothetical protein
MKTGRLTMQGEGMRNDDDFLDLGGGQVADLGSEGFWRDPERLRHAAAYLRQQSERPIDPRFPVPPQPEPARANISVEDLLVRRVDDVVDYEARRTARARAEIEVALTREQQQAEQQRKQDLADARTKAAQTSLGRLLGVSRHG